MMSTEAQTSRWHEQLGQAGVPNHNDSALASPAQCNWAASAWLHSASNRCETARADRLNPFIDVERWHINKCSVRADVGILLRAITYPA
jgi:hypothetical protein